MKRWIKKERYSYQRGIDWGTGELKDDFYIEHGYVFTLFKFIHWKKVIKRKVKTKWNK